MAFGSVPRFCERVKSFVLPSPENDWKYELPDAAGTLKAVTLSVVAIVLPSESVRTNL
jgi:hypothetical protein